MALGDVIGPLGGSMVSSHRGVAAPGEPDPTAVLRAVGEARW